MLTFFDWFIVLLLGISREILLINEEFVVFFSFLLFNLCFFALYLIFMRSFGAFTQTSLLEKYKNLIQKNKTQWLAIKAIALSFEESLLELDEIHFSFFDLFITLFMFNIWTKWQFGRAIFKNLALTYQQAEQRAFRSFLSDISKCL
jgi:hypothetical protein